MTQPESREREPGLPVGKQIARRAVGDYLTSVAPFCFELGSASRGDMSLNADILFLSPNADIDAIVPAARANYDRRTHRLAGRRGYRPRPVAKRKRRRSFNPLIPRE
jgi:hypothetical protein